MWIFTAAVTGLIVGMWCEYYSGRLEHAIRQASKKMPAEPVRRDWIDECIDDCEQFDRAMIRVPAAMDAPERLQ